MSNAKRGKKVTTGHKVTIGAVSVLGLLGGWSLIAHGDKPDEVEAAPLVESPAVIVQEQQPTAVPTPWPTIAPLARLPRLELEPLPTLAVTLPPTPAFVSPGMTGGNVTTSIDIGEAFSLAAMPTPAPLPALPEYTAPPPPPPMPRPVVAAAAPPPAPASGGNSSQGS